MLEPFVPFAPEQVWGLFTRGLGLVFLISFASLAGQIVRACGRDGGLPIGRRLDAIARDFPTWRRFYYFPTLLWLGRSDGMLRALTLVGCAAALLVIWGGPLSPLGIALCYVCYLSLDLAIGLIFPWDSFLFECVVLALFLPPTLPLPELAAVAAPAPAIAWAYRLLVFRVMFGFGKQKFMGSTSKDMSYLKGFLIAQPLPSKLGFYAQKLPDFMLKGLVFFMFLAEIPIPFFAFVPGDLSLVCAAATVFLMIGIQAMGSFGYFSLVTIVGCIALLDQATPTQLSLAQLSPDHPHFAATLFVLLHTIGACFTFPFNSWVAQSWHLWAVWFRFPRLLQLPLDFLRFMHPFRWLHPYGVFPPNTGPGVKVSLLVEVTWDRQTWHELDFHYSACNPASEPRFIAPYHPRGDQAVIYETFGLNPTSLISSTVGPWDPYSYGSQPAAITLVQRIVEGRGTLFLKAPLLEQRAEPPLAARISTVLLEPLPWREHRETGLWWKRRYIGPHTPPREHDPHYWEELLPEPELWHFDAIFWRRRSKLHALMERSRRGDEDPLTLALADAPELSAADVERFWNELVPMVPAERRSSFDTLPDVVDAVRARFERSQLRALYRLLGRFSLLLIARVEPLYLGRGLSPEVPATTYFHLFMATHHIVAQGREAYLAAMRDPKAAITAALAEITPESGLYYLSIFRFENMVFEAQKLRLITAITPPHDEEEKRKIAFGTEHMTDFQRFLVRAAESASGFFSVMPTIRGNFLGPRFDRGYPELYPSFKQLPSGEVVLAAYKEPPTGSVVPLAANAAE